MQIANGNLTVVIKGSTIQCYWKGILIQGVQRALIHCDEDDLKIKLAVSGSQEDLYSDMISSGIGIRKVPT